VTVFGSARFPAAHRVDERLGFRLGRAGFTVMTGGGPGVYESGESRRASGHQLRGLFEIATLPGRARCRASRSC
jgi:predicted Rossmann-fold nucleotide-binding protein